MNPAKRRIVIHGADNFVGRRLVAALSAESNDILPVATLDDQSLANALGDCEAVVHCVTGGADTIERGARALYGRLTAAHAVRVVHLSSMTVYGSATGTVDESSPLRPDLGAYSQSQCAAEAIAGRLEDVVILRPGGEYGPTCVHWTLRIARLLLARRLGDLGVAGDGCCNLLYIDDLVQAMVESLKIPSRGVQIFNLAVNDPPTWNEYLMDFARALGAVPVRRVTRRRLKIETRLLAPWLKAAELATRAAHLPSRWSPPPISPSLLALCGQDIRLDGSRAERTLGLRWMDIPTGLARAAAWSHEHLTLTQA